MNPIAYLANLLKRERPAGQRVYQGRQQAGVYVDADRALTYAAVWASVRIISETIAALPWRAHRRIGRGNEILDGDLDYILHVQANDEIAALNFRETALAHAILRGNAYAEIERTQRGDPWNMWPVAPDKMNPDRTSDGRLWYVMDGQPVLEPKNVFHLKGLGFDGLVGYPVIDHAAKSIGLGIALDTMAAATFQNGGVPGAVIHAKEGSKGLSPEGVANLLKSFEDRFKGPANTGKAMYLDGGMQLEKLDLPLTTMQFLESRQFQITEIARWFRVPPHKIADLTHATFTNIEHQSLEFVTDALMPWIGRLEAEAQIKLIGRNNRMGRVYSRINVSALLRGDIKSRYDAYGIGRDKGWLSANDIREMEDMNPVPGGDEYLVQSQMVPQDMLREMNEAKTAPDVTDPAEPIETPAEPAARLRPVR